MKAFLLVFSLVSLQAGYCLGQSNDSLVLTNLYDSTGGPNWTNHSGWLTQPVYNFYGSSWYGISVPGITSSDVYIMNPFFTNVLTLSNNNLKGTIPGTIFNGSFVGIDLSNNSLTGTIPADNFYVNSVGSILFWLKLQNNQLSGNYPSTLADSAIQYIDVSHNQLSGPFPYQSFPLMQAWLDSNFAFHLAINDNKFTFDGIEQLAGVWGSKTFVLSSDTNQVQVFPDPMPAIVYAPQDSIPTHFNSTDSILSVSAGGTLSNNTYTWYRNNQIDTVIVGDSTRKVRKSGSYYVAVTNSIATQLTLYSKALTPFNKFYLIDPNPNYIGADSATITVNDPSAIDLTKVVTGAATDGVTKILIVGQSNDPVQFSLSGDADGSLSTLDNQGTDNSTVVAQPVSGYVMAIYTAADGYGAGNPVGGRTITITAAPQTSAGGSANISVALLTPPIVMIHGMWSSPNVWTDNGFYQQVMALTRDTPVLVDYSRFPASTFNPSSPASLYARIHVQQSVLQALSNYRNKGIAATQVDVLAHSLGGLMARSFSQQPQFFSPANFKSGYIHKLITLGTPHLGTPLGPALWNNRNEIFTLVQPTGTPGITAQTNLGTLAELMSAAGKPIGPCHEDFGANSLGLQALSATPYFYTYAIAGNYLGNGSATTQYFPGYLGIDALSRVTTGETLGALFAAPASCGAAGTLPNDLIVPVYSQYGGISSDSLFWGTGHSTPAVNTEVNSAGIQNLVVQLLLSTDGAVFTSGFPAYSNTVGCANISGTSAGDIIHNSGAVGLTNNSMPAPKMTTGSAGGMQTLGGGGISSVQISSPTSGGVYQQNGNAAITLQYQVNGNIVPASGVFIFEGDLGWDTASIIPPYSTSITLPNDSKVGNVGLVLLIRDTGGVLYADTTHVFIAPSGTLTGLSVSPGGIELDSMVRETNLLVEGNYENGGISGSADLSNTSTGTTYSSLRAGKLFTVDNNGLLVAAGPGTDTLMVSNGGFTVKVPVTVDSNFLLAAYAQNQIQFDTIGNKTLGSDLVFSLSASVTSGENISFTVVSGNAAVKNGIVTLTGTGPVSIQASSAGDEYFLAAPGVTQTFCVTPGQPGAITGDTASCLGNQTYSLSAVRGIQYQWTVSEGGTVKGSDSSVVVTWTATGRHIVSATPMADSCAGTPATLTVTVTGPPQPMVTQSGSILKSSADSGNQWFLDSVAIPGAVDSVYHPATPGSYSVAVMIDSCVSPMSNSVVFDTTGSAAMDSTLTIYPNPFGNTITVANGSVDGISIQLFDMLGRLLLEQRNGSGTVQLATGSLAHGCYIIVITDEETKKRYRKLLMK